MNVRDDFPILRKPYELITQPGDRNCRVEQPYPANVVGHYRSPNATER